MDFSNSFDTVDEKRDALNTLDENSNNRKIFGNKKTEFSNSKKLRCSNLNDGTDDYTDSSESWVDSSVESVNSSSSESEDIQFEQEPVVNRKRKEQSTFNRSEKKMKKQTSSKSEYDHSVPKRTNFSDRNNEVLRGVLKELFKINAELDGLSKSFATLEHDVALSKQFPGFQAQSKYTLDNLPTFPIATNLNKFQSGDVIVSIPVQNVDEVNKLNTILQDKITFEAVVNKII